MTRVAAVARDVFAACAVGDSAGLRLHGQMNQFLMYEHLARIFGGSKWTGCDERDDRGELARPDALDMQIRDPRFRVLDCLTYLRLERRIGCGIEQDRSGVVQQTP